MSISDLHKETLLQYPSGKQLLTLAQGLEQDTGRQVAQLASQLVNEAIAAGPNGAVLAEPPELETPPLYTIPDMNCLTPRGKYDLHARDGSISLVNAKSATKIKVPAAAVQSVLILDAIPGDKKKKVLLFLALARDSSVMNGKQRLDAVVLQTTADSQLSITGPNGDLQGLTAVVICQVLGMVGVAPDGFLSPDSRLYQSFKGDVGLPTFIKAQSGFLFPMSTCFAFVERPPLFVPHHEIRSVELARAQGASATFDLVLHLYQGAPVEFGQIDRKELGCLQSYIAQCRLQMYDANAVEHPSKDKGVGQGSGSGAAAQTGPMSYGAAGDDDDDDDEDDEDFDPHALESEDEEPVRKGSSKGAARAGGAAGRSGAGSSAAAQAEFLEEDLEEEEVDEDEDESDGDDDDVILQDEEGISAAHMAQLMQRAKKRPRFEESDEDEEDDI